MNLILNPKFFFLLTLTVVFCGASIGGPLHDAVKNKDIEQVKRLLASGADVNAKNGDDASQFNNFTPSYQTPLHEAAWHDAKAIAVILIDNGANVNARDGGGETPLHAAAHTAQSYNSDRDIASLLIANGADVNAKNDRGDTPLHAAAEDTEDGAKDIVTLLIAKGADLRAKNRYDETPLHEAAESGSAEIAEILIEKGADVNARDKMDQANTPLQTAAFFSGDHTNITALLIARGADIYAKDAKGKTALQIAEEQQNTGVAALLRVAESTYAETEAVVAKEESLGDEAAKSAKLREAFTHYMAAFAPSGKGVDLKATRGIRIKIADIAGKLDPKPAIPEEAQRHMARGAGLVEVAKNSQDFVDAANEFEQARDVAPWWADAYNNEGVARDKGLQYEAAIECFKLYVVCGASEPDTRAAQNKIYAIEAKMDKTAAENEAAAKRDAEERVKADAAEQARARALLGRWCFVNSSGQPASSTLIEISGFPGNYSATTSWVEDGDTQKITHNINGLDVRGRHVAFKESEIFEMKFNGRVIGWTEHINEYDLSLSEDGRELTGTESRHQGRESDNAAPGMPTEGRQFPSESVQAVHCN